ncbi:hypothetical protein CCACVL1_07403, partial [Corchorus capsularis]
GGDDDGAGGSGIGRDGGDISKSILGGGGDDGSGCGDLGPSPTKNAATREKMPRIFLEKCPSR